jgi:hypothetical protein
LKQWQTGRVKHPFGQPLILKTFGRRSWPSQAILHGMSYKTCGAQAKEIRLAMEIFPYFRGAKKLFSRRKSQEFCRMPIGEVI